MRFTFYIKFLFYLNEINRAKKKLSFRYGFDGVYVLWI